MPFAPGRKFGHCPGIGLSRIGVANVGSEEFDKPFGCVGGRCEEGGEFPCGRDGKLDGVFHGRPLLTKDV